jgi:sugar/nucleoside kinase (ribokinase family)
MLLISGLNSLLLSDTKILNDYLNYNVQKVFSLSRNGQDDYQIVNDLLSEDDIIFCNHNEANRLYNINSHNIEKLYNSVKKGKLKRIIVTLGKEGVLMKWDNTITRFCALMTSEVKNSIGAGDCFCGAFLATWISTNNADKSMKFASKFVNFIIKRENWLKGIEEWKNQNISL